MEDDRTTALESQLGQAKQIAEEADKKYEEVRERAANKGSRVVQSQLVTVTQYQL